MKEKNKNNSPKNRTDREKEDQRKFSSEDRERHQRGGYGSPGRSRDKEENR